MSVVVAIKQDGKIYLGSDTMVTFGDSKRYLTSDSSQKIWVVSDSDNCIMGGVGYLRDVNLIHYCTGELVPEKILKTGAIDLGTMMTYCVPNIFQTIREYQKVTDGEAGKIESSFMWAYKDRCFVIYADGNVDEVEEYDAIGSGADAALASLKSTRNLDVYTRLHMALEASADISLYVGAPYVCIDTEDCQLNEIYWDEDGAEILDEDTDEQDAAEPVDTVTAEENRMTSLTEALDKSGK